MKKETIFSRYTKIQSDRRNKLDEAMKEYDRTIYHPSLESLRKECDKQGHVKGKFDHNGWGFSWYYCENCGAKIDENNLRIDIL